MNNHISLKLNILCFVPTRDIEDPHLRSIAMEYAQPPPIHVFMSSHNEKKSEIFRLNINYSKAKK